MGNSDLLHYRLLCLMHYTNQSVTINDYIIVCCSCCIREPVGNSDLLHYRLL